MCIAYKTLFKKQIICFFEKTLHFHMDAEIPNEGSTGLKIICFIGVYKGLYALNDTTHSWTTRNSVRVEQRCVGAKANKGNLGQTIKGKGDFLYLNAPFENYLPKRSYNYKNILTTCLTV